MDGDQQLPALAMASPGAFEVQLDGSDDSRRFVRNNSQEGERPMHLDPITRGPFLTVSADKLCVKYSNDDWLGTVKNAGAIRANRPSPRQMPLFYFEVSVKNRGRKCFIGIGFAEEGFQMNRQPGWDPSSYGYHGSNGCLYARSKGDYMVPGFGPTFSTGDTVGAGINYLEQELFFTKNGKLIDMTWLDDTKTALYPTIGMSSPDEEVEVNFGQKPFMFNVEALTKEVQARLQEDENV